MSNENFLEANGFTGDQPRRDETEGAADTGGNGGGGKGGSRGFKLSDLGGQQFRASIGGASDAALQAIIRVFADTKEHESPDLNPNLRRDRFTLVPLTANNSGHPTMLVTLPLNAGGQARTLVYVIILEQPGTLQTRTLTDNREAYESLILPEDQMNRKYLERIKVQLGTDKQLVIVGSTVILAEVTSAIASASDNDSTRAKNEVAPILNNAIDALSGHWERSIAMLKGEMADDLSIQPSAIDDGGRIEVQYDHPVSQDKDTSGLPTRADVVAHVYYTQKTSDDMDNPTLDRIPLGTASAALDLYLDDGEEDTGRGFGKKWGSRKNEPQPFWQAVLDVTAIGGKSALPYNLELAQFLLAQMAVQTNDHRWVRALRPKATVSNQKGVISSMVDLGILNVYNPDRDEAGYIKDIGPNSSDESLIDYLATVIRPEVTFGMTIPSNSEKSHVTSLFERIAVSSGKTRDKLIGLLYESANLLTDGKFSEYAEEAGLMDVNYSPIYTSGTRDLIGVWYDDANNLRAGNEWSVAAFASRVGDRDGVEDLVRDYQLTYETARSGRSVDFNLSQRRDMIIRWCNSSFRVIGTAEKLIIDPAYMAVLSRAISETALDPFITNADGIVRRQRAGSTAYRNYATRDIGSNRRRDRDAGGNRQRSVFSSGSYF